MPLFKIGRTTERYGAIIDIGSGSVLVAIVHSQPHQSHPHIIWSHREHAPLRNVDSLDQSAKAVMTALVSASMSLDAEGRRALYEYNQQAKLSELQCSIAAPWSYTVTKTINYSQEEPFIVTEDLIDELTDSVQDQIKGDLQTNEALQDLGLNIIVRGTMDVVTNGYRVKHPHGQKSQELSIAYANAVAQQYLIDAINEMQEKLFPETEMRKISFTLMMFMVTRELLPDEYDVCLVDVTYEATEIGVVRDGTLMYCTHTPFGAFSLAREISEVTGVPLHESFGYLHTEKPYAFMDSLPAKQRAEVEQIFESYTAKVTDIFKETGDTLAIPKRISLHSDLKSESLFLDLIEKAAKRSIKSDPRIVAISKEIIKQTYAESTTNAPKTMPNDTALLLSAQFFHKRRQHNKFEYL